MEMLFIFLLEAAKSLQSRWWVKTSSWPMETLTLTQCVKQKISRNVEGFCVNSVFPLSLLVSLSSLSCSDSPQLFAVHLTRQQRDELVNIRRRAFSSWTHLFLTFISETQNTCRVNDNVAGHVNRELFANTSTSTLRGHHSSSVCRDNPGPP